MNARSICSHAKLTELQSLVTIYDIGLIAITETWLSHDVLDTEVLPSKYNIMRKDRCETRAGQRGGGVLLGVDSRFTSRRRPDLEAADHEIMVCETQATDQRSPKTGIVICYRPPSSDVAAFNAALDCTLNNVSLAYCNFCVLGDFNMPAIDWRHPDGCTNAASADFVRLMLWHSLEQMNYIPSNQHGHLLDLVFTTNAYLLNDVSKLPCSFPSDHVVLHACFSIRLSNNTNSYQRTVYNYKRANFDVINRELHESLSLLEIGDLPVDNVWNKWNLAVKSIIDDHVPKNVRRKRSDPPWFDSELRHLVNLKRAAWKRAKKRNTPHAWGRFKELRSRVKAISRRKHKAYIRSLGDVCRNNPKRFWSHFRSITKCSKTPSMISDGVNECYEPKVKAQLFNDYFCSVFSVDANQQLVPCPVNCDPVPMPTFTAEQIAVVMQSLNVYKACAPEDISPVVLKACRQSLSNSLARVFNLSMTQGRVPTEWKKAFIVPLHKKGDKYAVQNYRPISLLSSSSKIMERCVADHIFECISPRLHVLQHGFMKNRSTTTQLLKVYNTIGSVLDVGGQVDIAFLDFSKAFDSVSHACLLYKLQYTFGFDESFLQWFKSYLLNRFQCVVMEGERSDWQPVTSGVPQGSILGPLLFLMFINDLPDVIVSSTVALFADDCKIFKVINDVNDSLSLQKDLNELHNWSTKWNMQFNASKCKIMRISRSNSPVEHNYYLDGTQLECVGNFKDLGVMFDTTLSFKTHISSIVAKANRVSGMIKRSIGYSAPLSVKLTLYKSLVRPNLEYNSQVWSPFLKCEISCIESVQRSFSRYICRDSSLSYQERCILLKLLPLSFRREFSDLMFCFKYFKGYFDVDFSNELRIARPARQLRTSSHGILLADTRCRTEHFIASYFKRIPFLWNSLPLDVRNCSSLFTFKQKLLMFYFDRLTNVYDSFNSCSWSRLCRCNGHYHV